MRYKRLRSLMEAHPGSARQTCEACPIPGFGFPANPQDAFRPTTFRHPLTVHEHAYEHGEPDADGWAETYALSSAPERSAHFLGYRTGSVRCARWAWPSSTAVRTSGRAVESDSVAIEG